MRYIRKTIFVAVVAAAALSLVALAGVTPAEAQPTPTPTSTATVPPPTPTATPVPPTATPTATALLPTPTPTATVVTDPHISFYPALLSFTVKVGSAQSPEKALYIQNKGSGNLKWSVSATFPWLGLYPKSGDTPAGDVDTVAVWVDPEGLSQGTHTVQIMVYSDNADNSPQWVYVSVEVGEEEVVPTATPTVTPTASPEAQPTPTLTPTPTPTPVAAGGLPMWVWPVVGVLAVLALAFGVLLLHPARLWGRLRGLFARGGGEQAEGLTKEEMYEETYGDDSGEPPEDYN